VIVLLGEVSFGPVPTIRFLTTSFLGGVPPGVLTVGSVLNAVGSLTFDEEVDAEVVVELAEVVADVAGVAAAEVAPPDGARTTPAAVVALLLDDDEPQPAMAPLAATAMQRMESVFRMNAAGG
jgi:hypothetical protein